ncbi:MAG TPA: hypothetical protein VFM05_08300, partial [Candidatus Saccharimonadales bacterium]|nr:hypothetical protein [Candidatus Saccharimonadales bacterium]
MRRRYSVHKSEGTDALSFLWVNLISLIYTLAVPITSTQQRIVLRQKAMANKCPQCELVNWEHEEVCKRCGASLNVATPPVFKWFVVYCVLMAL